MFRKLNLGCGQFPKKDYINADIDRCSKADVICDLSSFSYPFKRGSFELIEADHLLEHLEDPFRAMREFRDLLVNGGRLIIRVPHFSRGFTHPEHKRGFDVSFPYYFHPGFQGGYTGIEFSVRRVRLRWFSQAYLKRTVLSLPVYLLCAGTGRILDFLANISPMLCSRLWAFWVGGFEEIEFHFVKS